MATLIADIAYARNPAGNPGVVDLSSGGSLLLAIVDGWGSWGDGMEAAARAHRLCAARWAQSFPETLERAADDMHEIASSAPLPGDDPFADGAFHAVVLLMRGTSVQVAAAGLLPVMLLSGSRQDHLFKPRMLLDAWVEQYSPTPAEIDAFPHKNVCVGPYLAAAQARSPMVCTSPRELVPGELVVVANPRLFEQFASDQGAASLRNSSAVELRDRDGKRWSPPVVLVSHRW